MNIPMVGGSAQFAAMDRMMEAARLYETKHGTVTMRQERPDDDAFLYALFYSHTARPLQHTGLAEAAIEQMVRFQYRSQTATHRLSFPGAVFSIIESEGMPIGRLIEADEGDRVYFVDFALLPDRQAKGLGTAFIEMIAGEWGQKGRAARVEVQYRNEPSLKLCNKLGFVRIEDKSPGYVNLLRPIPAKPESL